MSPIQQLLEELKTEVHEAESLVKKSGVSECQKKIYTKQRDTLNDVIFNLENNYINLETAYINAIQR